LESAVDFEISALLEESYYGEGVGQKGEELKRNNLQRLPPVVRSKSPFYPIKPVSNPPLLAAVRSSEDSAPV